MFAHRTGSGGYTGTRGGGGGGGSPRGGHRLWRKVWEVEVIEGPEGPEGGLGEHLIVGPQDQADGCRLVAMLVAMRG